MLAYKENSYNMFNLYIFAYDDWLKLEGNYEPAFVARLLVHMYLKKYPDENKNILKIKLVMLENLPDSVKAEISKVSFDNFDSIESFLIAIWENMDTDIIWKNVSSKRYVGDADSYLIWVDEIRQEMLAKYAEPNSIRQEFTPELLSLYCKCKLADEHLKGTLDINSFAKYMFEVNTIAGDLKDDNTLRKLKGLATKLMLA